MTPVAPATPHKAASPFARWLWLTLGLSTVGPFLLATAQYLAAENPPGGTKPQLWIVIFGRGELFLASTFLLASSLTDILFSHEDDHAAIALAASTLIAALASVCLWGSSVVRAKPSFGLTVVCGLVGVGIAALLAGFSAKRRTA